MFKKNAVLSSLLSVALLGLTACGGGSSDDSAPTTPSTGGTTNPGTGGGTTPTNPTTPTTPTPVNLEFASGSYVRENRGQVHEAVLLGDRLYYGTLEAENGLLLGFFENFRDHISDGKIIEAPGFYKRNLESSFRAGVFSANLNSQSDKSIINMNAMHIADSSDNYSILNLNLFNSVSNVVNLNELNDIWVEPDFSVFRIDDGFNLTAVDKNNCNISGVLTEQGNKVFSVSLQYTDCPQAGSYDGALWAYIFQEVTYLKWFALDSENNFVTAVLDDYKSPQDAVAVSGQLGTNLFIDSSNNFLISKDNILHYAGIWGKFVFDYTPPADSSILTGNGKGLDSGNRVTSSTFSIPIPKRHNELLSGEFITENNNSSNSILRLARISQNALLTSLEGNWENLVITNAGSVSGVLSGCNVSGQLGDSQGNVYDIELSLSGCDSSITLNGLAVGYMNDGNKKLVMSLFHYSGTTLTGLSGVMSGN